MLNFSLFFGLLGILGVTIYAIGDVLLLAGKANITNHPKLTPHIKILSSAEKMVELSHWRFMWGGLLGVFATPLVIIGFLQIGMSARIAESLMFPPFLLFALAAIVGAFVHGSFIYLVEYVQALDKVSDDSQFVIIEMLKRHRKIMIATYGFLLVCILIASVWFSIAVGMDKTYYPVWMAAFNPVTLFGIWMFIKRFLPSIVQDWTEGAGFNIAYLLFFILTTITFHNPFCANCIM
jgi:hypothetical protein